jgi:carboxypeptidase T
MMLVTVSILLASQSAPGSDAPSAEVHKLVRIEAAELAGRPRLLSQLGFDHVGRDPANGAFEVAANPAELAALEAERVDFAVLVEDLAAWYASRLTGQPDSPPQYGAWLSPVFGSGSMGGYYPFAQVESVLDQIHAAYPSITTAKTSIGTTVEGRNLWMIKVSDSPGVDEPEPEMRIDAMHHAREPESMQSALWFLLYLVESYGTDPLATYLVNNREIYFVPVVNPDGYVYNQTTNPGGGGMWRKNRRNNGGGSFGVDLNRNYADHWGWDNTGSSSFSGSDTYRGPSAASEPEIQAMQAFFAARQFRTSLTQHTHGNLWLHPFGYAALNPANQAQYAEVGGLATAVNLYTHGPISTTLYLANGVTVDYDHDVHGTMSWTPEIGSSSDGFWPPTNRIVPLAEENLLGQQRTALAAGAWARVLSSTLAESGDGDGRWEPGESAVFSATVRNSGRGAPSTPLVLTLTTSSPYAVVTNPSHDFGALAAFTQANSSFLTLAISPGAPDGASIGYQLTLAYEGWSQVQNGSIVVGPLASAYCTAKTNSLGCVPAIGWSGAPSASSPTPFVIGASSVISHKTGLLLYGHAPSSAPFQGGYLCVQAPTKRTPVQDSGGGAGNDCSGVYAYDFNARIQSGADPALVPPIAVYAQYWSRDPASPSTTGLTNAVSFQVGP